MAKKSSLMADPLTPPPPPSCICMAFKRGTKTNIFLAASLIQYGWELLYIYWVIQYDWELLYKIQILSENVQYEYFIQIYRVLNKLKTFSYSNNT